MRIVSSTRSLASGFSMKSNAPAFVASTAVVTVPWPEMITTGSVSFGRLEPLQRVEAVHAGHLDVEEYEIRCVALGHRDARPGRSTPPSTS